jgi:oxygen-dependent protoporphyrinogen oxidase
VSDGTRKNIVVVGAGLAGLAAAWRLQQQGHDVSVLERRDEIGGRIGASWEEGFCMDRSLQVLHSGDRHLLGWIAELGLSDALLPLRPLQLAQLRGGVTAPIDPQRLAGVGSIPGVRPRDAVKLVRWSRLMGRYRPILDPTAPERAAELDFRSVADHVRLYFGNSCYERWAAPEVTADYSGDAAELSRVALLLGWVAHETGRGRGALHGIARSGLHEVPRAAAEQLSIRHGVEVTRVDEEPSGGFGVECHGLSGGRGTLAVDAVVLATAAEEAGRIGHAMTSPAERDYLEEVRFRPSITLAVALDRPLAGMPQLIRAPHVESEPADAILVEPGIAEGRAPTGAGLVTLAASERFALANAGTTDDVIEKGLLASLERIFPGCSSGIRLTRLERREQAIPSFDVGAYRALANFRKVQRDRRSLSRRLYFAGDYLIGPRAEDAVVSGFRAAQDFAEDTSAG